jgi:hypothetical protein
MQRTSRVAQATSVRVKDMREFASQCPFSAEQTVLSLAAALRLLRHPQ